MEAIGYLFPIQLDGAVSDVLGALGVDLVLSGHLEEWFAVDGEEEFVGGQIIVEDDFPLQLLVLQDQWEQPLF